MYYMCITHFFGEINMQKEIEAKREKYYSTSVRLPKDLYKQLELKSTELGDIGVSETIRILLSTALQNSGSDFLTLQKADEKLSPNIQYQILQNVVTSYYLLKDQIELSKEGIERSHASHEKGKKAMAKILGQSLEQISIISTG